MKVVKRGSGFKFTKPGFSTIELMVALSLFAVVSVAAIQFVSQNEISLLEGRNKLTALAVDKWTRQWHKILVRTR